MNEIEKFYDRLPVKDLLHQVTGTVIDEEDDSATYTYLDYEVEETPEDRHTMMGLKVYNEKVILKEYTAAVTIGHNDGALKPSAKDEFLTAVTKHTLKKLFELGSENYNGSPFDGQEFMFSDDLVGRRRLTSRMLAMGNFVAISCRRGPSNFAVVNSRLAGKFDTMANYVTSKSNPKNGSTFFPIGMIAGITIYVDLNMAWTDTRMLLGRSGNPEEPGLHLVYEDKDLVREDIKSDTMAPKAIAKGKYRLFTAGKHPETSYVVAKFEFEDNGED